MLFEPPPIKAQSPLTVLASPPPTVDKTPVAVLLPSTGIMELLPEPEA